MKQLKFWNDPYEPFEDGWWIYWALENKAILYPDFNITIYIKNNPIMGIVTENKEKELYFSCNNSCFSDGTRLHLR